MKYNATPGSCEIFAAGEVEDYTVVIAPAPNTVDVGNPYEQSTFGFEIYPNPVREKIHIVTTDLPDEFEITIQDVNGRVMMQSSNTDQLDVSMMPSGVYLLGVSANGEVIIRKFIRE